MDPLGSLEDATVLTNVLEDRTIQGRTGEAVHRNGKSTFSSLRLTPAQRRAVGVLQRDIVLARTSRRDLARRALEVHPRDRRVPSDRSRIHE